MKFANYANRLLINANSPLPEMACHSSHLYESGYMLLNRGWCIVLGKIVFGMLQLLNNGVIPRRVFQC